MGRGLGGVYLAPKPRLLVVIAVIALLATTAIPNLF